MTLARTKPTTTLSTGPRVFPCGALVAFFAAVLFAPRPAAGAEHGAVGALLERLGSLVVAIELERVEDSPAPRGVNRRRLRGLPEEDRRDLEDYFNRPSGPVTGLLLDREGNVLTTNYNLGREVKDIRVVLAGGRELPAEVVARDGIDDLALLRITGGVPEEVRLPALRWAEAGDLQAGAFVVALGRSPDPGRLTATLGIVSASRRNFGRLLQTDAALNQGNVGGPLVDLDGRVLGLAAFVGHDFPHWGLNSGIGFGVRADRIREVLPVMVRGEDVPFPVVPFLGVRAADSPDDAGRVGARIREVVDGSSAEAGGLKPNDVIVEWAGEEVHDFMHLRHLIYKSKPGGRVVLVVERDGARVDLELTLGERKLEPVQ